MNLKRIDWTSSVIGDLTMCHENITLQTMGAEFVWKSIDAITFEKWGKNVFANNIQG